MCFCLSGVFCCGPVPVRAIKEGELTFKYDASFVFAEVNADLVYTLRYNDGSTRKIVNDQKVGQKISTKSVGRDEREDITHLYKYPEGKNTQTSALPSYIHTCEDEVDFAMTSCRFCGGEAGFRESKPPEQAASAERQPWAAHHHQAVDGHQEGL